MKTWPYHVLFGLWAFGAVCSAVSHLVAPGWTAAGTTWLLSPHWQREIAYFDLLVAVVFVWAIRQPDMAMKRRVALLLCALSAVLGENHLEGWLTEARIFHVTFTLANFLAVAWGLATLAYHRHCERLPAPRVASAHR